MQYIYIRTYRAPPFLSSLPGPIPINILKRTARIYGDKLMHSLVELTVQYILLMLFASYIHIQIV